MKLNSAMTYAATVIAALAALPRPAAAQDEDARVASLFQRWDTRHTPGAAVLIVHNGVVVHRRGYGMADLEHDVPIAPNTVFDIASVSKQFAAMAIALLEADGRIALDDDVRRYIPELPDFGSPITIRHLLHHTSGLRDWPGTLRLSGWLFQDVLTFDQILRMAMHQRELNFTPGAAYAYSNTGYNVLAEVVQRVSGRSFREFTDERIFQPLGMRDTHFHDDHTMLVRNRAGSYARGRDGAYRNVPNNLTALGSSSLFTTIDDLARWLDNFRTAAVGGTALVERLHQRGVLNGGDTIAYAFGHSINTYRGTRQIAHTGSWAGFRTVLQRYPEHGLDIVILANTDELVPAQLATQIADIYIGTRLAAAEPPPRPSAQPESARWTPADAELREYAGTYRSAELMTFWTLAVRDGRLVAFHVRAGDVPLQPRARDVFDAPLFGEVRFERAAGGAVTGFTATSDRVRGLRFTRDR